MLAIEFYDYKYDELYFLSRYYIIVFAIYLRFNAKKFNKFPIFEGLKRICPQG